MTGTTRAELITLGTGRATSLNPKWDEISVGNSGPPDSCRYLVHVIRNVHTVPDIERDCRGEDSVSRSRKPSVFQVGKIRDDGRTVVISGWGLGLCASACACHRHPVAGHLAIAEDQAGGCLGLASYREDGCDCCEPWTAEELAAVLRDLDLVAGLQAQEPLAG
jgi:hypothetical protein